MPGKKYLGWLGSVVAEARNDADAILPVIVPRAIRWFVVTQANRMFV